MRCRHCLGIFSLSLKFFPEYTQTREGEEEASKVGTANGWCEWGTEKIVYGKKFGVECL